MCLKLKKKKLEPKFHLSLGHLQAPTIFHGRNGTDGVNGLDGSMGVDGAQGLQGATGADGLQGIQGDKGLQGDKGKQGEAGKDAKQIERIEIYSRIQRTFFTDGSSIDTPISRPQGTIKNPGHGTGGAEPFVKNIFGGTDIEVLETNGRFTINFTGEAEDFMDADDKANLALLAANSTELITNQQCQLNDLKTELLKIKTHVSIMTEEELLPGDEK